MADKAALLVLCAASLYAVPGRSFAAMILTAGGQVSLIDMTNGTPFPSATGLPCLVTSGVAAICVPRVTLNDLNYSLFVVSAQSLNAFDFEFQFRARQHRNYPHVRGTGWVEATASLEA